MYHKPFFSLPAWREPFSTVPRCQLITFCTYQKEETLGKVLRYQGQHIWRPTAWGMAATRALKAMQRNNQIAIIKEFTVMPNHIHLFIFYKKFHPPPAGMVHRKDQGIPALLHRTAPRLACPHLGRVRRYANGLYRYGPIRRRRKSKRIRPSLEIRPAA